MLLLEIKATICFASVLQRIIALSQPTDDWGTRREQRDSTTKPTPIAFSVSGNQVLPAEDIPQEEVVTKRDTEEHIEQGTLDNGQDENGRRPTRTRWTSTTFVSEDD